MGSYGSGHGCHNVVSSVHYYPDAFYTFNKIASWGSEISAFFLLIFIGLLIEAFYVQGKKA